MHAAVCRTRFIAVADARGKVPTEKMAVVGRQVQIVATEDGVRRVEREVIVDPESGLAAEVQKVTIAVDVGDGNIAIAQQERVQVLVTGTEVYESYDTVIIIFFFFHANA